MKYREDVYTTLAIGRGPPKAPEDTPTVARIRPLRFWLTKRTYSKARLFPWQGIRVCSHCLSVFSQGPGQEDLEYGTSVHSRG